MTTIDPTTEYKRRLASHEGAAQRYAVVYGRIAVIRLIVAVVFLLMAWTSLVERAFSGLWLLVPFGGFVLLAIVHSRIAVAQRRTSRAIAFYEDGLARIEDRWAGRGQVDMVGEMEGDQTHLYSADLDLFGHGSLFDLLSTARTRTGNQTLAGWLLAPANRSEIVGRQQAVEDLRPMLDLREDLATLGAEVVPSIHPDSIVKWGEAPVSLPNRWPRLVAPLLALITIAAIVIVGMADTREAWLFLIACFGVEWAFVYGFRHRVQQVLAEADQHGREFKFISLLIQRIEGHSFKSEKLRHIQSSIKTEGTSVSLQLDRFARLMELADMRRNQMFGLLFFLLAMTQVAFALESWRRVCGPAIRGWMTAIGDFEALCSLSGYGFEHPDDPFPEIVQDVEGGEPGPVFDGRKLRHPLIPANECVPNSLGLGTEPQMMIVSGSNMSGKSTLLRTVGINSVLALAGAPVRAESLRISVLRIGSTLRVLDSLQEGTSRFYAEIQRIRRIVDLTSGDLPVLFLLDEVLHGTNSHDRAIGAEGILRGLIKRGAIGLVTTHDLALTRVADELKGLAANVHFEDRLEDGAMKFDYQMKSGVVEKSNALELMRALGLDV
jgi:hypothetical protein